MKKIISGVLSAVMLTSVLCACNDAESVKRFAVGR